jgi:hypothetical protein
MALISRGQRILGYLQHPAAILSIGRGNFQSSYFCRKAIPAFASHRTGAQKNERGPDGIRTRICDRRRVLCSRYTTGPERVYLRLARIITVGYHNGQAYVSKEEAADESL